VAAPQTWFEYVRQLAHNLRQLTLRAMNKKSNNYGPRRPLGIGESVSTPYAAALTPESIRRGLPVRSLDHLAELLHVDRGELAGILGVSLRTLQRKAGENQRLGAAASDRLARVRRILDLATAVLGAQTNGARWLTSRSRALGGEVPLRMLDTDLGTQQVEQELHQIEFGFPF
jgi:putative toxin-antitoxin system antitoxin component (TIGR02293 family)